MRGAFSTTLTFAVAVLAGTAGAQSSGASVPITVPLKKQFAGDLTVLQDKLVALAQAIPAEKYSWHPGSDVRTISQVLMHVAGEWFYMCPLAVAGKPPADFGSPNEKMRALEQITEKTEVLAQLDKSWAHCRSVLDAIDPSRLIPDFLPARMGFPEGRVAHLRRSGSGHRPRSVNRCCAALEQVRISNNDRIGVLANRR